MAGATKEFGEVGKSGGHPACEQEGSGLHGKVWGEPMGVESVLEANILDAGGCWAGSGWVPTNRQPIKKKKKNITETLCWFLPGATRAKASASGTGRIETRLSWLPVQHPARGSGWYSCPPFKQWKLLPWQLFVWWLLQEQQARLLHYGMQIKASRHSSLQKEKKKKIIKQIARLIFAKNKSLK